MIKQFIKKTWILITVSLQRILLLFWANTKQQASVASVIIHIDLPATSEIRGWENLCGIKNQQKAKLSWDKEDESFVWTKQGENETVKTRLNIQAVFYFYNLK